MSVPSKLWWRDVRRMRSFRRVSWRPGPFGPVANHDGDWSDANRFYPLHRAELAVLARVVNEARTPRRIGPRARLSLTPTAGRATPRPGG